jgi:hypothetical protein
MFNVLCVNQLDTENPSMPLFAAAVRRAGGHSVPVRVTSEDG